jgi:hypothetical protein
LLHVSLVSISLSQKFCTKVPVLYRFVMRAVSKYLENITVLPCADKDNKKSYWNSRRNTEHLTCRNYITTQLAVLFLPICNPTNKH